MSIPEAIFFKPSSLDGLLSGARKHRSAIFKQAEPPSRLPDAREDNREPAVRIQAGSGIFPRSSRTRKSRGLPLRSGSPSAIDATFRWREKN